MRLSDFDYNLPKDMIAQHPLAERSLSRLMVLDRKGQEIVHRRFSDILDYLDSGDLLVLNDTKVIPARLLGRCQVSPLLRSGQATVKCQEKRKIEILLLKRLDANIYSCLMKPSKKVNVGDVIEFDSGELKGEIVKNDREGRVISFKGEEDVERTMYEIGSLPLPPYIKRRPIPQDVYRYQTVYARKRGAVAAPTAGLHFTKRLLNKLNAKGISLAYITLHVGYGTFSPVRSEDLSSHKMESEYFEISSKAADLINRARGRGGRIIGVGTTSVRALESAHNNGRIQRCKGETGKFIYPPYRFKTIDALLTNFHLPRSTLLMLVSAFAGREFILRAYEEAIAHKYRFYSYGDAMLII